MHDKRESKQPVRNVRFCNEDQSPMGKIQEQHPICTQDQLQIESNLLNEPMVTNNPLINTKGRLSNHWWSNNNPKYARDEL